MYKAIYLILKYYLANSRKIVKYIVNVQSIMKANRTKRWVSLGNGQQSLTHYGVYLKGDIHKKLRNFVVLWLYKIVYKKIRQILFNSIYSLELSVF